MYTVCVKPFSYTKENKKTAAATFLVLHLQKGVKNQRNVYNILIAQHIRPDDYMVLVTLSLTYCGEKCTPMICNMKWRK